MIETLVNFDKQLLLTINSHHNDIFDFLMFWISNRLIWIPFYLVISLFLLKEYNKQFFFMIFFIAILIALSDQFSVLVKDFIQRPRPCHDGSLQASIHLVNGACGGAFGFVSSHASNSAALVTFLFLACNARVKWIKYVMIPWALLVSYSRMYLGSHYPLDILGGWLIGIFLGILVFFFYQLVAQSRRGPIKYH